MVLKESEDSTENCNLGECLTDFETQFSQIFQPTQNVNSNNFEYQLRWKKASNCCQEFL